MTSQQPQARPWLRLASLSRAAPAPAPAPTPAPAPQAQPSVPQPRPPFMRPAFGQPFVNPVTQPPPAPAPAPLPPTTTTTSSVPSSPVIKTTTPSPKTSPTASTTLPITSSSLPPSPKPTISAPSSSLPPSPRAPPSPPPTTRTSSVPTSPITKTTTPTLKTSPTSTTTFPSNVSSSVPPSPKPRTFVPSSLPASPAPKLVSTFPAPVAPPPSPVTSAAAATFTTTTTATARLSSPRVDVKPPITVFSPPKTKPLTPPPSPLTLPPAQLKSGVEDEPKIPLEAEQKTVLVQETIEKPKVIPRTFIGDHQRHVGEYQNHSSAGVASNEKRELTKNNGNHKKKVSSDSEEFGMRIITIAGENKGAIMELSPSHKKHYFGGNPKTLRDKGNPRTLKTGEKTGSSSNSDEEWKLHSKDSSHKKVSSLPLNAYMNSNVQGVNNSILHNVSCSHHDPGVHLSLSKKANGIEIKDRKNG